MQMHLDWSHVRTLAYLIDSGTRKTSESRDDTIAIEERR
jgi:hypothetical protein